MTSSDGRVLGRSDERSVAPQREGILLETARNEGAGTEVSFP
jgi:hypothetical protein